MAFHRRLEAQHYFRYLLSARSNDEYAYRENYFWSWPVPIKV